MMNPGTEPLSRAKIGPLRCKSLEVCVLVLFCNLPLLFSASSLLLLTHSRAFFLTTVDRSGSECSRNWNVRFLGSGSNENDGLTCPKNCVEGLSERGWIGDIMSWLQ